MTQDEIADLYQKANGWNPGAYSITMTELEHFAKLVAAKEREACANTCYELMLKENPYEQWNGMKLCMEAIRARGEA